jgi:hypothetical protein
MKNNKQQTAVDIIYQGISDKIVMQDLNKALICIHISHDDFLKLHKQAKEMEKEQKIKFAENCLDKALDLDIRTAFSNVENYYNETFKQQEQ